VPSSTSCVCSPPPPQWPRARPVAIADGRCAPRGRRPCAPPPGTRAPCCGRGAPQAMAAGGRISAKWGSPVCVGPWPPSAARELRIVVVTPNLRCHVSSSEINLPSSSRGCSKSLSAGCARGDLTFAEVALRVCDLANVKE
jgi:hypothetical protein